jgi:hypothetical protein
VDPEERARLEAQLVSIDDSLHAAVGYLARLVTAGELRDLRESVPCRKTTYVRCPLAAMHDPGHPAASHI